MRREDEIEYRRRAKKKKLIMRRRKFLAGILVIFAIIIIILSSCSKKDKKGSVSGDSLSSNETDSLSESENAAQKYDEWAASLTTKESENLSGNESESDNEMYDTTQALDVSQGNVQITISDNATDEIAIAKAAKKAMSNQAYFIGCSKSVNDIMTSYGEGGWHAIVSKQNDLCVFYEGKHDETSFCVNFVVFDDGTFQLKSVIENDKMLDDYIGFVTKMIG